MQLVIAAHNQSVRATSLMTAPSAYCGPVFLIGMPRSGTKLLRELLNRHPRISIPDSETEFLPLLAHNWDSFGDLSSPQKFGEFYEQITRKPFFTYQRADNRLVSAADWYRGCKDFTPAGVFEALIRLDVGAAAGGDVIWGDKSPSYIDDLALLKSLYPAARFIHIIRDVRDYCLSIRKAWGKDMLRAAQRWAQSIDGARSAGAQLGCDYMELRYEDLLVDTEIAMRRVSTFLEVRFDAVMLTLTRPTENLGYTRGETRVVANNFGKFLDGMNRRTLARIEALAGETLVGCGYSLAMPAQPRARLSRLGALFAQMRDAINLVRSGRRERGLVGSLVFHIRYFLTTRG